eukprot:CAMPEP_0177793196 /NCGR_PEP_ID=MMETSP0491_2-20121128/24942_1 /TAXON_ID=63592 /ORGANISM="Tetraselmis chuii, Strain PLY429" /LENGTH=373 /DNA_ID=CAMNT_0019315687 /DNA_START=441 /DNA_END=1564 /DNA_ORIENTATION=+
MTEPISKEKATGTGTPGPSKSRENAAGSNLCIRDTDEPGSAMTEPSKEDEGEAGPSGSAQAEKKTESGLFRDPEGGFSEDGAVYEVAWRQLRWWEVRCNRGTGVWAFFAPTTDEDYESVDVHRKGPKDHKVDCWLCHYLNDAELQSERRLPSLLHRAAGEILGADIARSDSNPDPIATPLGVSRDLESAATDALEGWKKESPSGKLLTSPHLYSVRYCSRSGIASLTHHVKRWHPVEMEKEAECGSICGAAELADATRGSSEETARVVPVTVDSKSTPDEGHRKAAKREPRSEPALARGARQAEAEQGSDELWTLRQELHRTRMDLQAAKSELMSQRLLNQKLLNRARSYAERITSQAQMIVDLAESQESGLE